MSDRPHVLWLVNSLDAGGAEKHAVQLANGLDRRRFRVSLVQLKGGDALRPQVHAEGLAVCDALQVRRRIDFAAARRLAALVDRHDVGAIACVNPYSALYAVLATHHARRSPKLLEVLHNVGLGSAKDSAQMLFYRRLLRRFDALVYVSGQQRAYWRQRGLEAGSEHIIENGIDVERFRRNLSREERDRFRRALGVAADACVVGVCAGLRREKAHGDLLHAIARLRTSGRNVHGLLIGDGAERARIERLAARLGLTSHVTITGFVADVRAHLQACDVFCLPSHHENFSIAVLEAMALELPIVLSRVGGAAEQIEHGRSGLLYDAGDIDALVDCIAALAAIDARERFGAAARVRVAANFSQQVMLDRYEQLLGRLLQPPYGSLECAFETTFAAVLTPRDPRAARRPR